MLLSVIILSYKVPYYLQLCLESVQRATQDIEAEIIVADNNSSDETAHLFTTYFPQVHFIENSENLGFARAYNQAVQQAKGKYFCILNPDTVLPEACFKTLLAFAEKQQNFGALGPRLIDGAGAYLPESKRNIPTPKVALKKMTGDTSSYYANQLAQDEVGVAPVLVGAFMIIIQSAYHELGGFDEAFFMYGEDIDLSYRLLQLGYANFYCGNLPVIHFKGESTIKDRRYFRRFYKAMHIFQRKHFSQGYVSDKLLALVLNFLAFSKKQETLYKAISEESLERAFWCSDSEIPKGLATKLEPQTKCESVRLDQITTKLPPGILIFDMNALSFTEVISTMQLLKNSKNRFRIRPSNCNFILGSDASTHRGALLKW